MTDKTEKCHAELLDASALKRDISYILLSAVNGQSECYRTKDGFIRWGLVEKDIHNLIDVASGHGDS